MIGGVDHYRFLMPGPAASDLTGRLLAGRYLLHAAIGTGASGRVHLAHDTRLRRRVAVKVLHAALADDAAFLRRFRAEAQLAASLQHPHIVTVHDWGEDEVPFMVLELCSGGSLRTFLDSGARCSPARAARIGRDVAGALAYAHERGVVHRDIKPANLLFDEHGEVRVADFGLARALAEASWTEPTGGVLGTARYASPEQARGAPLDGRSDCYALALVTVESVTGTVPFAAETTMATLAARTREPITAPAALGALGPVVERAGALEPGDRYPDAATLRSAFADVAARLPEPEPMVLVGLADAIDPDPTRAVGTVPPLFDQDAPSATPPDRGSPRSSDAAGDGSDGRRGERRLVPFVVALVMLATVGLAAAALTRSGAGATTRTVPVLAGLTRARATTLAEAVGFSVGTAVTRPAPDAAGTVIGQEPPAGTLTTASVVRLVISGGPPPVRVPEVVGDRWALAAESLADAGVAPRRRDAYDETRAVGVVLAVEPAAGVTVAPGSTVTVTVSKGRAPVAVPTVAGRSYEQAAAALRARGFVPARGADAFSATVPKGAVAGTVPAAGKVIAYGAKVTVAVSKGPDLVTVPELANLTLDEASAAAEGRGLTLEVAGSYRRGYVVVSQDPDAGARIRRGSAVTVRFGPSSVR